MEVQCAKCLLIKKADMTAHPNRRDRFRAIFRQEMENYNAVTITDPSSAGDVTPARIANEERMNMPLWPMCALALLQAGTVVNSPQPRDMVFTALFDGTEQRYAISVPADSQPSQQRDVLIALHGHGSDRWQFMTPKWNETRAVLDTAAKFGMILVAPDYRAKTSWMGPAAEADVVQIIAEIKSRFRTGRVLLCGASMGGSSALTFAALHPELVDGVVAMNATANHLEYVNFQDAIAASFGGPKNAVPLEYKKRSAEYWPERLTMPVAITTGGRDRSVPPESALRLGDVLRKIGRKVFVIHRAEIGHTTTYADAVNALEWLWEVSVAKEAAPR
jgi:pimeloyl-ACP methyl ester carboxylesterase